MMLLAGFIKLELVNLGLVNIATVGNGLTVSFYALSAVVLLASIRAVSHPQPVQSAVSLLVSLWATAGIFFMLGASFAGVLQLLIFSGVLLLGSVFLLAVGGLKQNITADDDDIFSDADSVASKGISDMSNKTTHKTVHKTMNKLAKVMQSNWLLLVQVLLIAGVMILMLSGVMNETSQVTDAFLTASQIETDAMLRPNEISIQQVGQGLFSDYAHLVVLTALLLFASVVVAVSLLTKSHQSVALLNNNAETAQDTKQDNHKAQG